MELIKNLLKYFIILLIIVFLACSLMAGIMFLFPNVQLFGVRYAAHKNDYNVVISNVGTNIKIVNIETNGYNINILPNLYKDATNNNLHIAIENNYTGYSMNGVVKTKFLDISKADETYVDVDNFILENKNMFQSGDEYTIKLKEPTGILSLANSNITIYIPQNANGVEYNLKTNKGKITFSKNAINTSKMLSTSNININVSSARGSFNLDNAHMVDGSDLTISNYIGRVEINSQKIGNVNINSNSGNFTFKNIGYDGFVGGNLTVSGNNPYVRVDKVYGNVSFNTETGFIEAKEILGDSILETKNGIIRIDSAFGGIQTENISGETTIKQIGKEGASVKSVRINSRSGNINLGNDEKGIYYIDGVVSQSGRVVIKNLYSPLTDIETTSGSINVTFALDGKEKALNATTTSGKISLYNIYGNITAKTGNSSNIYAQFDKISALSNFETDGGNIELVFPSPQDKDTTKQYTLNLQNRSNKLEIVVGGFIKKSFDGNKNNSGYYELVKAFPETVSTSNTINAKTINGKIIVTGK